MNPQNAPKLDPSQIMQTVYTKKKYQDFCPWICSNAHQGIHTFFAFSMATMYSPDDPFFWLHHCNVDRFLHLWLDCNEYDKISKSFLGTDHFMSINPTTKGTQSEANDIVKDANGNPVVFTADTPITFYVGPNTAPTYLPATQFPTVRSLWTCGTDLVPGWNGLKYRYGIDDLAKNVISSVCAPGNTWTYVNYGSKKRSGDTHSETDSIYQNITQTFMYLTEEKGMTPQEAVDKMAWDNCMANPNVWTEESKKILRGIGLTPSSTKRICDNAEDLKDDEEWEGMSHHM